MSKNKTLQANNEVQILPGPSTLKERVAGSLKLVVFKTEMLK